jgi:hypothetical protein
MIKKTYIIKGLDCPACATSLECDLECFCKYAKCSYVKGSLEVILEKPDQEKLVFETVKKANLQVE